MDDVHRLWSRLKHWADANAPEIIAELNPGATSEALDKLESELGIELPASFKASLSIHDGEDDGWPCRVFADHGAYLSTSAIAEEWHERQRHAGDIEESPGELDTDITVDGPVQAKLFLPKWIPFLECNGDVFWALDFAPADGGTRGQVIEVDWEGCSWRVVADSFYQFLEDYVIELEQGEYDEVIAGAGHNQAVLMDNGAAGQFRLMTGAVVILAGLYLINGSGSLQFILGVLALLWGGLILGRWWRGRTDE